MSEHPRDCPHGRQWGKCDTCDLLQAHEDIAALEAELATVTGEKDRVRRVADTETKAKFRCWDFIRDHGLGQEFYEATHFSFAKGSSRAQKEAGE